MPTPDCPLDAPLPSRKTRRKTGRGYRYAVFRLRMRRNAPASNAGITVPGFIGRYGCDADWVSSRKDAKTQNERQSTVSRGRCCDGPNERHARLRRCRDGRHRLHAAALSGWNTPDLPQPLLLEIRRNDCHNPAFPPMPRVRIRNDSKHSTASLGFETKLWPVTADLRNNTEAAL
jgi:hypothetical protein